MANYLRPRRGKKATAISQNVILKKGEVFFEVPDSGVGTGAGKIKMGDGITTYSNLPYFYEPAVTDVSTAPVNFTESSETSNANLLNAIATGAQTGTLIGSIKKLLRNLDTSVTSLNNDLENRINYVYYSNKGTRKITTSEADSTIRIDENVDLEMGGLYLLIGGIINDISLDAQIICYYMIDTDTYTADIDYKKYLIKSGRSNMIFGGGALAFGLIEAYKDIKVNFVSYNYAQIEYDLTWEFAIVRLK